jgi:hypothetical protein
MLLQEYSTVLTYQSACVDKTRKQIDSYFNNRWLLNPFVRTASITRKLSRDTSFLIEQLLASKGLIAVIEEKLEKLRGKDLSETIIEIDRLIKIYINLKVTFESIVSEGVQKEFPEIIVQQSVLADTISNLYLILRMLKRQNLKKNVETSQFARDSSRHSVNSLETVLHGRSST